MKQHLLFVACILMAATTTAQQLWKEEAPAGQAEYMERNQSTLPDRVKFYALDASALQSKMLAARPFAVGAATSSLDFPLPDGNFMTANVYESSILSPETQALIPNVKTYLLADRVSNTLLGRVTITDNGITGLLFTDKGSVYINPVDHRADRTHIVYYTKELHVPQGITCGVTDEADGGTSGTTSRVDAGDCHLRTYRLAVAATGEYYVWAGSSQAQALTYITTCINVVDAIYERDATIRFTLVTNNSIIYTDAATDPYPGTTLNSTVLDANNTATNLALGAGNYDVGIVFNNGYSGGLAQLSSVCTANHGRAGAGITFGFGANATPGPQGPTFDGTVAHEIGHQFSATHTMASGTGGCAGNVTPASAWEPGGGSTIMAYAGTCTGTAYQANSDLYFHVGNVGQIANYSNSGNGNICPTNTALVNVAPTVSVAGAAYTIPISTPFFLTCSASDLNGNVLSYTWEQMDAGTLNTPPQATSVSGPNFRSFPPNASPTRYLPDITSVVNGFTTPYEVLPSVARTMNFRVDVRDNAIGGGCTAQADIAVTTSTASIPFAVTSQSSPTTLAADGTTTFLVTWDVGSTTAAPFNSPNVMILFSADGGNNFNYILRASTANDGTEAIVIPNIITSAGRVMVKSIGNIFYNINTANITITSACAAEGAALTPGTMVSSSPGHQELNLSIAPTYGSSIFPTSGAQLTTSDPISTLAVFNSVTSSCQNFNGNMYEYDTYKFQVSVAGSYTFTRSPSGSVFNIYAGDFSPGAPCANFVASNATYNGSSVGTSASLTVSLLPGIVYTLAIGTFSNTSPVLPYSYTVSVTATPPGGGTFTGYLNPGGSYSYAYVIVNSATNNIVAISSTPDLRNTSTFPNGTYTVYGFSYLTANFPPATLAAYVGGPLSTLTNDLTNNFTTRCGNLSKNAVTVNIFAILPVRILPLTAVWENTKVKLYWSTAQEVGSKAFEIERSADGQAFSFLKSIPAAINSDSRINYISEDASPLPDKNFYRIKAIDQDDKFVYSNTALVKKLGSGFEVRMYPNPTKDQTTIEILASRNGSATLELINAGGSQIYKKTLNWKKGINVEPVDMQNLPAGVYYIRIISEEDILSQKLIKI